MSKGSIFWGKSRGKLGEMVLSVVKGQQTQRAYNARPANPRTEFQMLQRMRFASAGKFFAKSQQALFKMAFEGKTQLESDFNAFMRYNLKEGIEIYPTKEEVDNPFFPMIAPWRMSKGSLDTIGIDRIFLEDNEYIVAESSIICTDAVEWYDWAPFLDQNPSLRMGDIITFVTMYQQVNLTGTSVDVPNYQPNWVINSIKIGADLRGDTLYAYINRNGLDYGHDDKLEHYVSILQEPGITDPTADNLAVASCCIVSRQVNGKLRVSSEHLHLNNVAGMIYEFLSDDGNRAMGSWDTAEPAILQGKEQKNATGDNFTATTKELVDIVGQSAKAIVWNVNPAMIEGDTIRLQFGINGITHTIVQKTDSTGGMPHVYLYQQQGKWLKFILRILKNEIWVTNTGTDTLIDFGIEEMDINGNNVSLDVLPE